MKMQDMDHSVLALYYIYCAHPVGATTSGYRQGCPRLKVYSMNNSEQWFHYENDEQRQADLDFINRWIEIRELGEVPSTE